MYTILVTPTQTVSFIAFSRWEGFGGISVLWSESISLIPGDLRYLPLSEPLSSFHLFAFCGPGVKISPGMPFVSQIKSGVWSPPVKENDPHTSRQKT